VSRFWREVDGRIYICEVNTAARLETACAVCIAELLLLLLLPLRQALNSMPDEFPSILSRVCVRQRSGRRHGAPSSSCHPGAVPSDITVPAARLGRAGTEEIYLV